MDQSLCIVELRFAKEQSLDLRIGTGKGSFSNKKPAQDNLYNTIETLCMRVQHVWLLILWEGTIPLPPLLLLKCL